MIQRRPNHAKPESAEKRENEYSKTRKILTDGLWGGRRCFIIGGGESIQDSDFSLLRNEFRGELTIGINRAFEKFDPTIIFSMDARFWGWIEHGQWGKEVLEAFYNYKGLRLWLNTARAAYPPDIYTLPCKGASDWSESLKDGLGGGSNSGYGALNLAWCLGANPIYLLGFDMKGNEQGKQAWWHDGYPIVQPESVYKNKFIPHFNRVAPQIKHRVINLNPDSALRCFEFGSIKDIEPIKRPVIVSYYTRNTGYEKEVNRLELSIRRFGLECDIQCIDSLGSWIANVQYKPTFIAQMLEKHKRPVLYLDADAAIIEYPELLDDYGEGVDLALHYRSRPGRPELLSGTIWVNHTPAGIDIIKRWINENQAYPAMWDQRTLDAVLKRGEWKGVVDHLPAAYCCIYDTMAREVPDPVIEHYQASRRLKREVGT